jgi:hypothetical protein
MNDTAAAHESAPAPRPRRRARWLRVALALVLAFLVVCFSVLFDWLGNAQGGALDITVNGAPLLSGLDLAGLPDGYRLALAFALAGVALSALLVVGAALVAVALLLVPALLLAVALPLLAGAVAALAVFSPLLLLAWLLWHALRPASPTMRA